MTLKLFLKEKGKYLEGIQIFWVDENWELEKGEIRS